MITLDLLNVRFPIGTIEVCQGNLGPINPLDTTQIHIEAIWMGAGNVKGSNAAMLAEVMLCGVGIKLVGRKVFLSAQ